MSLLIIIIISFFKFNNLCAWNGKIIKISDQSVPYLHVIIHAFISLMSLNLVICFCVCIAMFEAFARCLQKQTVFQFSNIFAQLSK